MAASTCNWQVAKTHFAVVYCDSVTLQVHVSTIIMFKLINNI